MLRGCWTPIDHGIAPSGPPPAVHAGHTDRFRTSTAAIPSCPSSSLLCPAAEPLLHPASLVEDDSAFSVRVGTLNLQAGLVTNACFLPTLMVDYDIDVLGVSETHARFGDLLPALPSATGSTFGCLAPAPPSSLLTTDASHSKGGVALVYRESPHLRSVEVLCDLPCATVRVREHVGWFKLVFAADAGVVTLIVGVVYVPPPAFSVCSTPGCEDSGCVYDHCDCIFRGLREQAALLSSLGHHVVVLGDMNAMPPLTALSGWSGNVGRSKGAARRYRVAESVLLSPALDSSLVLANPDCVTRVDPVHGHASLLDWILTPRHLAYVMTDVDSYPVAFSDHYLVACMLHLPPAAAVDAAVGLSGLGITDQLPQHVLHCSNGLLRRYRLNRNALIVTVHSKAQWERVGWLFNEWWTRLLVSDRRLPSSFDLEAVLLDLLHQHGLLADRATNFPARDPTLQQLLSAQVPLSESFSTQHHQLLARIRHCQYQLRDTDRKLARLRGRGDQHLRVTQDSIAHQLAVRDARAAELRGALSASRAHAKQLHHAQQTAIEELEHDAFEGLDSASSYARLLGAITRSPVLRQSSRRCPIVTTAAGRRRKQQVVADRASAALDMQLWYEYLCKKYSPVVPTVSPALRSAVRSPSPQARSHSLDRPVAAHEVAAAIRHLRNESAALGAPIRVWKLLPSAPAMLEGLAGLFNSFLDAPDSLPLDLTSVALHPIPKPGRDLHQKDNWRTIGYGTSLSRILQTIINVRLHEFVDATGCLHSAQAGFMSRLSSDMLVWLTTLFAEDEILSQRPQYRCFVDVKAAFASTRHVAVAEALVRVGVCGKLAGLVLAYLERAHVHLRLGQLQTSMTRVTIGLVEGVTFSPILWNIVLDPLLHQLDERLSTLVAAGLDVTPMLGAPGCEPDERIPMPSAAYADDLVLQARQLHAAQGLLDVTRTFMDANGLELGLGPDKTAGLLSAALQDNLASPLMVGERVLPLVPQYKYLGVITHCDGPTVSAARHRDLLLGRLRSTIGHLRHSGLRNVRPLMGVIAYLTRIRPKLTYSLSTWGVMSPSGLSIFESSERLAMATIMNADARGLPSIVTHAVLSLPTLLCELDRSLLRLVLRILELGPTARFHMAMASECYRWCEGDVAMRTSRRRTWWSQARCRLKALDAVQRAPTDASCPYVDTGVRFVPTIERLLLGYDTTGVLHGAGNQVSEPAWDPVDLACQALARDDPLTALRRMLEVLRYVTAWKDWHDRQAAIAWKPSLTATRDLLRTRLCDGRLPFLSAPRSVFQTYCMHLRAGTHYLLGHDHWEATCPWCGTATISVPHLLRDCPHWTARRQSAVAAVRARAIALGAMHAELELHADEEDTLWYYFMVGHEVPLTFLDLPVFPGTLLGARTRYSRRAPIDRGALQRYHELQAISAPFVVEVLFRTQHVFQATHRLARRRARDPTWLVDNPVPLSGPAEDAARALRHAARHSAFRVPPTFDGLPSVDDLMAPWSSVLDCSLARLRVDPDLDGIGTGGGPSDGDGIDDGSDFEIGAGTCGGTSIGTCAYAGASAHACAGVDDFEIGAGVSEVDGYTGIGAGWATGARIRAGAGAGAGAATGAAAAAAAAAAGADAGAPATRPSLSRLPPPREPWHPQPQPTDSGQLALVQKIWTTTRASLL